MPTRYHLGTVTPATANAAGIMAAFATLFAVANDVDTATAVSGVLTWTRDTTSGSQAIYSSAFGPRNCRIIIAIHDTGTPSPSPVMVPTADTYTAANILIGLCDNAAGNYISWNAAEPFYVSGGSGALCNFPGYYRLSPSASISTIRAMLSSSDLLLQVVNGTSVQSAHYGSVIKAPSGYSESDGFRYGGLVSGPGDMSSTWRSSSAAVTGNWGKHGNTNGTPHFGCLQVSGTAWETMTVMSILRVPSTLDQAIFGPGVAARIGIPISRAAAPLYTTGSWAGVTESCIGLTASNVIGVGDSAVRWSSSIVTTSEEAVLIWRTFT